MKEIFKLEKSKSIMLYWADLKSGNSKVHMNLHIKMLLERSEGKSNPAHSRQVSNNHKKSTKILILICKIKRW